jgi:hypothetical protein
MSIRPEYRESCIAATASDTHNWTGPAAQHPVVSMHVWFILRTVVVAPPDEPTTLSPLSIITTAKALLAYTFRSDNVHSIILSMIVKTDPSSACCGW